MEKFFLKRRTFTMENWQIGLVLIIAAVSLIIFGALVEMGARKKDGAPGIAKLSLQVAKMPVNMRRTIQQILSNEKPTLAKGQRFEGEAGFTRLNDGKDGALLLARYDGNKSRAVVEILDLENGAVVHQYEPDIHELYLRAKTQESFGGIPQEVRPENYLMTHPYLDESGSLIFHGMYTPLAKIDACSNIVWTINGFFHHSIERDADGNYWTATATPSAPVQNRPRDGVDDAITKISPDGSIVFQKSLHDILVENDLTHLIFTSISSEDPFHLNDIQPVMKDGPYWQKGDLFLSLRHSGTIMHYRPDTNKVIWYRQGPWTLQHDVDLISDHEIAVFDNNAGMFGWGEVVMGSNNTVIYNFSTGEVTTPYHEGYQANEIRTGSEGRSEILPDGEIFVEEQNYGRLLKMNAEGDITWQYINRADDGRNYLVSWARYLQGETAGQAAKSAVKNCAGGR